MSEFTITHEPADEYHGWPETSASQLKELDSSPRAYHQRFVLKTAPTKESASLSYGTLLHLWHEVGAAAFWKRAKVAPADAVTAAGQFGKSAQDWLATLSPDDIPISPADAAKLEPQTAEILSNPAAAELIAARVDSEFNVRFFRNGHGCRCRVDGATAAIFYDLKTTRAANPAETFDYECREWRYHLQAALYGFAAQAAGWPKAPMQFIATSNTYPYHCAVMVLPAEVMRLAEKRVDELLRELDQRRALDWWTPRGYGEVIEMPARAFIKGRGW